MPKTIDVMIDLETLGTDNDAHILSIGAVVFDRVTGAIPDEFYASNLTCEQGRKVDIDTVRWWMQQDKDAKDIFSGEPVTIGLALLELKRWFAESVCADDSRIHPLVWGNGSTFDISILTHACNQAGMEIPWRFWDVRDVRTVVDLAAGKVDKKSYPFNGTKHNALDDARHQVWYLVPMIQALAGG